MRIIVCNWNPFKQCPNISYTSTLQGIIYHCTYVNIWTYIFISICDKYHIKRIYHHLIHTLEPARHWVGGWLKTTDATALVGYSNCLKMLVLRIKVHTKYTLLCLDDTLEITSNNYIITWRLKTATVCSYRRSIYINIYLYLPLSYYTKTVRLLLFH